MCGHSSWPAGSGSSSRFRSPQAVHKAKLKIDEKGAEGAAGSGMQTLPMERPLTFKLKYWLSFK